MDGSQAASCGKQGVSVSLSWICTELLKRKGLWVAAERRVSAVAALCNVKTKSRVM
ncbi:Uncharacterized protein DAT39_001936 [Clarias magur]|uniref:Uncharacterized protein n=1 Tax=Clarias magur TaxID=1594786 RepID=A0A8J4UQ41_CLAMG|nr:Uncharacterized protein DAT39_001936 [Clarias magur]